MIYAVLILGLLCIILLMLLFRIYKQIKEINVVLDDIQKGNIDRRFVIHQNSFLADTCYKLNEIMMKNKEQIIAAEKSIVRTDKLMTSLSHDIRTPLTSIIGYLDAIHYQFINGDNSVVSIETARERAHILKQYIDELFQWFKLHSNDEKAEMKQIDLVEEIRTIYANWIEILENAHIAYDFITEKEDIYVMADNLFLERIINNLLKNALEHSEATRIWIEVSVDGDYVSIKVQDNGKGIPEKDIPYVFERLYKEDNSRNQVGSGLGLAITKELVLLQNGKIFVQSVQNSGTAFCVKFPKIVI